MRKTQDRLDDFPRQITMGSKKLRKSREKGGAGCAHITTVGVGVVAVAAVLCMRLTSGREAHAMSEESFRGTLPAVLSPVRWAVGCTDGSEHCRAMAPNCGSPVELGKLVRAGCPRTCKTCLANGTDGGALHARRKVIMEELARASAMEGSEPKLRVLKVGRESAPVLVIDDLLPPSVVRLAALAAAESIHWQPMEAGHKDHWRGGWRGSPRDAQGLFNPPTLVDGFPGLGTLWTVGYEELVWARLQQLKLEETFVGFTEPLRFEWGTQPFMGMVCLSPQALHTGQAAPHVDRANRGKGEPQLAFLHYLTDWSSGGRAPGSDKAAAAAEAPPASGGTAPESGGTAFYAERHSGTANFLPAFCDSLGAIGSFYCRDSLIWRCLRGKASEEACAIVPRAQLERWMPSSSSHREYQASVPTCTLAIAFPARPSPPASCPVPCAQSLA